MGQFLILKTCEDVSWELLQKDKKIITVKEILQQELQVLALGIVIIRQSKQLHRFIEHFLLT